MAKKGDWVRIHSIVLKAEERTAKLPDDTKKCDLQQWTKGFLQDETAAIGDEVTVKTAVGRLVKGTLIDEAPYYTHSYGKFVPEIIEIDRQLREIMNFGGEAYGHWQKTISPSWADPTKFKKKPSGLTTLTLRPLRFPSTMTL